MQRLRGILARGPHLGGIRRNAFTQSRRLITRRSQVQILPPLPRKAPETGPFCFPASRTWATLGGVAAPSSIVTISPARREHAAGQRQLRAWRSVAAAERKSLLKPGSVRHAARRSRINHW